MKNKSLLMGLIGGVIAVVVIVVVVVISTGNSSGGNPQNIAGVAEVTAELKGIADNANVLGAASAPVTVTEVIDPMCPACARFSEDDLPTVLDEYVRTGKVKMARVMWPLPVHGSGAVEGSYAALAAGRQGKLWPYTEIFMRNQGTGEYVTPEFLRAIAEAAKLDMAEFDADMAKREELFGDQIFADKDRVEGEWGLTATPGFHVKGPRGVRTLSGANAQGVSAAIAAVK